jgi:hypothetical protein
MNGNSPVLLSEAKGRLGALCRKAEATPLIKRGQVLGFIVPRKRMEDLLDYLEIVSNPAAMKAVARARAGKRAVHPLSAIRED